MSLLKKCLIAGTIVVALAAAAVAGGYHWANTPISLTPPQLDVTVKPHSSLRSVTLQLNRGGDLNPSNPAFQNASRLCAH